MAKFHISKGVPKKCVAKPGNCPIGGEHFESQQAAQRGMEEQLANEFGGAFGIHAADDPDEQVDYYDSAKRRTKDSKTYPKTKESKSSDVQKTRFRGQEEAGSLFDWFDELMDLGGSGNE